MNIAHLLQAQAQQQLDRPAIIAPWYGGDRCISFTELEQYGGRVASLLRYSGLKTGDRVLVLQPMSVELYGLLAALFRLGLVAMFLDPGAGMAHVDRCCQLQPPQALIASSRANWLRLWSPALRQIPRQFAIGWPVPGMVSLRQADRLPYDRQIVACEADTPALLTFTSGSTSQPKAALRSHGFLLAQYRALVDVLKLQPGEIDLATLPIFLLANLAAGVTSLIPDVDLRFPGRIRAAKVIRQICQSQPNRIVASPAFLQRLADYCHRRHIQLSSLSHCFSGGAAVEPQLVKRLQTIAPQAEVTIVYGSTEAEPIAHLPCRPVHSVDWQATAQGKGLLVGNPVDCIQLRILPDQWGQPIGPYLSHDFAQNCLPVGEVGEIVVSGDHVLPGYLHGWGDAETKFWVDRRIWHRTGDAGYLDGQGRLWLMGRCAAKLVDDRGVLYPFAVESIANAWPGVRRSAIVAHQGQRLLLVEPSQRLPGKMLEALGRSLAWANLDAIRLCRRIPVDKRHNAKIDYPALRNLLKHSWI